MGKKSEWIVYIIAGCLIFITVYINIFVDRFLIVLNVLDKTNRFKDCSFNIKHVYQNIIHWI